jgi:transcription termination factor Rho
MSVLSRAALEGSPLADLHAIASELGIDGFRRLRKADLVDLIIERQGGEAAAPAVEEDGDGASAPRPRRSRRGGRGRTRARDEDEGNGAEAEEAEEAEERTPRAGRGGRAARRAEGDRPAEAEPTGESERIAEGVVELLGNGSGFVRVNPGEHTDDDVYISAAQVRRCELVDGDRVAGPVRRPRRSERYPSLVRVDTINGSPAEEVAEGTPYDALSAAFPSQRFELDGGGDATLEAIQWLTPFGRGSRVVIAGPARAGKSEVLRRLAAALSKVDGVELSAVLAGVRPEEAGDWADGPVATAGALGFGAPAEAQAQAIERCVETAKRVAVRGADAVVLIDTLDGLAPAIARRVIAAARNLADAGSVTIIATAAEPVGGETTVVALDRTLTATRRFPNLDLGASGTVRPELLVGDDGARAIAEERARAAS